MLPSAAVLAVVLLLGHARELYERLGLTSSTASTREIKKAWHLHALKLHPDKVEGSAELRQAAETKFKKAAEAYEVLSDPALRAAYDRTGVIPDDKAKTEATTRRTTEEDSEFGFEGSQQQQQQLQQQQQQQWRPHGWRQSRWGGRFDDFEVGLAQKRARRVRTLEQLRRLLQPPAGPPRFGLVGFYRRGEEATLKQGLRFPYPFAGWSLASQGDGFWWEDAVQTALVSVGDLASNEGAALLDHFGLRGSDGAPARLPAVAWVFRDAELSYRLASAEEVPTHMAFVQWVYRFLSAEVRVVNRDHRPVKAWWLDGHTAKEQGIIRPGESFTRSSFVSHRWFFWPEATEGTVLGHGAALGMITLANVSEVNELILHPKCVDTNGHCGQWRALGECEKNKAYMRAACPNACGGCEAWGWLYDAGLGPLHERLSCWADAAACAPTKGYPAGGRELRGADDLRKLPWGTLAWLRGGEHMDADTRRALERALAPPPAPAAVRPPSSKPPPHTPSPPPPPPRDEL